MVFLMTLGEQWLNHIVAEFATEDLLLLSGGVLKYAELCRN